MRHLPVWAVRCGPSEKWKNNHWSLLMYYRKCLLPVVSVVLFASITLPVSAQSAKDSNKEASAKSDSKKSDEADMMRTMMEMAKPGENHKHLQDLVGTWSYMVK